MNARTKFVWEKFDSNIQSGEEILDEFSAAIKTKKILISGRFFVSTEALYFYSIINEEKFIFWEPTKVKILLSDVKDIRKGKHLIIFDNSIRVKYGNNKSIFFTSFFMRDKTYDIILDQMRRIKRAESQKMLGISSSEDHFDYSSDDILSESKFSKSSYSKS